MGVNIPVNKNAVLKEHDITEAHARQGFSPTNVRVRLKVPLVMVVKMVKNLESWYLRKGSQNCATPPLSPPVKFLFKIRWRNSDDAPQTLAIIVF